MRVCFFGVFLFFNHFLFLKIEFFLIPKVLSDFMMKVFAWFNKPSKHPIFFFNLRFYPTSFVRKSFIYIFFHFTSLLFNFTLFSSDSISPFSFIGFHLFFVVFRVLFWYFQGFYNNQFFCYLYFKISLDISSKTEYELLSRRRRFYELNVDILKLRYSAVISHASLSWTSTIYRRDLSISRDLWSSLYTKIGGRTINRKLFWIFQKSWIFGDRLHYT